MLEGARSSPASRDNLVIVAAALVGEGLGALLDRVAELPLRRATAALATAMLRGMGAPVSCEDTVVVAPGARFPVLLPCAGGKMLAATLVVGLVAALIGAASRRRRMVAIPLLVPLAVAGNAMRVALLVLAGPAHVEALHAPAGYGCFAVIALLVVLAMDGAPRRAA